MRVFVLALFLLFAVAGVASAQQPQFTRPSAAPSANVFSKTAIDRAVASTTRATPAPIASAKAAPVPRNGKSFWKSPWPYIIAGGVTAGVLIAVHAGNNNGTMGGY